jgi:hypothetical protein
MKKLLLVVIIGLLGINLFSQSNTSTISELNLYFSYDFSGMDDDTPLLIRYGRLQGYLKGSVVFGQWIGNVVYKGESNIFGNHDFTMEDLLYLKFKNKNKTYAQLAYEYLQGKDIYDAVSTDGKGNSFRISEDDRLLIWIELKPEDTNIVGVILK